MRKLRLAVALIVITVAMFVALSGQHLVLDAPEKAEVIVVLAGETERRPQRALELLRQGYAPHMLLDAPAGTTIYKWTQVDLAQRYVNELPQAIQIKVCPITGLSTKEESFNVANCLKDYDGQKILLVTSDYHSRRAFDIFSKALPNYHFSVASAYDAREFGTRWWQHREWAKTNLLEFSKFVWWELVERWN
jgi:uncharacterized SAM-binding protein YcdF (DUF218 family)